MVSVTLDAVSDVIEMMQKHWQRRVEEVEAEAELARAEADRLFDRLDQSVLERCRLQEQLSKSNKIRGQLERGVLRAQDLSTLATAEATALYERFQGFLNDNIWGETERQADMARAEADRLADLVAEGNIQRNLLEAQVRYLTRKNNSLLWEFRPDREQLDQTIRERDAAHARIADLLTSSATRKQVRELTEERDRLQNMLRTETHKRVQAEGQAMDAVLYFRQVEALKADNDRLRLERNEAKAAREATRKSPTPVTVRFNGSTWYGQPGDHFWINYDGLSNVALYRNMQVIDRHYGERPVQINTTPTPTHNYLTFDADDADDADGGWVLAIIFGALLGIGFLLISGIC